MKQFAVAIDGPSGAGKSTVAKKAAYELGVLYVDTGAMYRAIGLAVFQNGIATENQQGVLDMLANLQIDLRHEPQRGQRVLLNGEDVSELIRTPEIAMYASKCSAIPAVRAFLLNKQRNLAKTRSIIMDGRDIGTVVLPNAEVKIFLTAGAHCRAERRWRELTEKGRTVAIQQIEEDIMRRDEQDMNRPIAPLRQAADAVLLDTSEMDFDSTVEAVLHIIQSKIHEE